VEDTYRILNVLEHASFVDTIGWIATQEATRTQAITTRGSSKPLKHSKGLMKRKSAKGSTLQK
jgi:hypothetical protein